MKKYIYLILSLYLSSGCNNKGLEIVFFEDRGEQEKYPCDYCNDLNDPVTDQLMDLKNYKINGNTFETDILMLTYEELEYSCDFSASNDTFYLQLYVNENKSIQSESMGLGYSLVKVKINSKEKDISNVKTVIFSGVSEKNQ